MPPKIPVSEETKSRLDDLKQDEETYDELLARLVDDRAPLKAGAWDGTDKARAARETSRRVRNDFERRLDRAQ